MSPNRTQPDESPSSAFVREMKDALAVRSQAKTRADRRKADALMLEIMRRHLGPGALRAAADIDDVPAGPAVPPRRRRGVWGPRRYAGDVDRKLAAAGPDGD